MTAPERIYLQWVEDEALPYIHEGVTWCADKIEDDDVEYVRADVARATPADQEPVAWALKMADGKLDMTDATERPTDSLERWAAMNSHRYVPLNAAQYAMLQEILK